MVQWKQQQVEQQMDLSSQQPQRPFAQ